MPMSLPNGSTTLTLNDTPAAEDRMRAALGLTPGSVQQNHRPARSEGPTAAPYTPRPSETSDSLRARLATLTSELKAERSERVAAQQALADAQRTIQQLQTKLAHAEMAAAEALQIEHQGPPVRRSQAIANRAGQAPPTRGVESWQNRRDAAARLASGR